MTSKQIQDLCRPMTDKELRKADRRLKRQVKETKKLIKENREQFNNKN